MARILIISPYEPPSDGIAKHTARLVEAWDAAGHTVLVVAPGKRRRIRDATPIGERSRVARILGLGLSRRTWRDISSFRPDVLFVQFAIAAVNVNLFSVIGLCRKFKDARVPVIIAFHEPNREYNLLGPMTRSIYRAIARTTDVPIVFSAAGRESLMYNSLFREVVEVPHGTTSVAQISEEDIARVSNLYKIVKPLVLVLGFTTPDKGADILISAASAISHSRHKNVQFLIAGSPRARRGVFRVMGHRDVKYGTELVNRAQKLVNVDFALSGFVADQDVAALLHLADVVVLPYRNITQSGIANLALSSQSVIVSSDLPGLRSDLGDAARYVPVGDSTALAGEISWLLGDDNANIRQQMRDLAGQRAAANSYAKVAESILDAGMPSHGRNPQF
jgi:glycosyltransferase involved in cell wall biosynthesis